MSARFSQVFSLYFKRHLKRRGHWALAVLGLIILTIDVLSPTTFHSVRRVIDGVVQPFDHVVGMGNRELITAQSFFSRLFHQAEELKFLRKENSNLRLWRQYAQALETENRQLNSHFHGAPRVFEGNIRHFRISKRVPSAQILEFAAKDMHTLPDFAAVISSDALIGRLLSVQGSTNGDKHIMLLSHPESRVPVQVGKEGIQAMLAGQGNRIAKLEYHSHALSRIKKGDLVVSSRFSAHLPSGLTIGHVESIDEKDIEVKLSFNLDLLRYIGVINAKVEKPTQEQDSAKAQDS